MVGGLASPHSGVVAVAAGHEVTAARPRARVLEDIDADVYLVVLVELERGLGVPR